ncbi:MAG: hypothetical protein JXB49_11210 [Bacteroidales bacterium]|nr:hypothetical protein [Bacteroidales bacterium]
MKTKHNNTGRIIAICLMAIFGLNAIAQKKSTKPTIAIIGIDTKDMYLDDASMASLVRLELEKADVYEVLDRYDVASTIKKNSIDIRDCYGKTAMVKVGQLLNADKMLTGSAEKFGDKIIFILRMIDVKSERIEKTDVMEYINQQEEIQYMVRISVNNILDIQNDQQMLDLLVNFDRPITSSKTTLKLNGPRMGATWTSGRTGIRLESPKSEGGFNMYPVTSMFGYQYEVQYLSSGEFQALLEFIGAVNGLESGTVVPSLTFLNGFRFNKSGWEIGLGPVFRISTIARGFYDSEKKWHLMEEGIDAGPYPVVEAVDSRGEPTFTTNLIIAAGRTFKSGYLNIPVNVYASPSKEGTSVGLSFGFNVAKKPKL